MTISRKQIAMLQVARKQLGLADEDYYTILWHEAGARSSRDLDNDSFDAVLRRFERLGFKRPAGRPRQFGHRWAMATPAQVAHIRRLWSDFTDGQGDDRSLGRWLEKTFKVSDIAFVGERQAAKVITALIAMNRRAA